MGELLPKHHGELEVFILESGGDFFFGGGFIGEIVGGLAILTGSASGEDGLNDGRIALGAEERGDFGTGFDQNGGGGIVEVDEIERVNAGIFVGAFEGEKENDQDKNTGDDTDDDGIFIQGIANIG